jgi:acetyl esterase/lipase
VALLFLLAFGLCKPSVRTNVVYGQADGEPLLLDVYQPKSPGPHAAVLLIHGGGWIEGDKRGYEGTGTLLALAGYVAFSINYRLARKHPYPAALDDCQRAARWVRAHAAAYHVDPARVGALGNSAGGHLAALLGVRDTRDNQDPELAEYGSRVQAVVDYYGATDLERLWRPDRSVGLEAFMGGPPAGREGRYREASPATWADRASAPFLMLYGTEDHQVPPEQARLMDGALRRHGVESTLLLFPGAGHGWPTGSRHGWRSLTATLTFLGRHLGGR